MIDQAINSKFNAQTYRHIGWAIDDAEKIIDNRRKGIDKSLVVSQTKLNESLLKGIPWNRIVTVAGKSGCLEKGTKVLMYNGSFKAVEDVIVADQLMGIDSKPRNVLELKRGIEQMYMIEQKKGMSYTVNESHILSLKRVWTQSYHRPVVNGERKPTSKIIRDRKVETINISVKDYLELLNKFPSYSDKFKGYVSEALEFKKQELIIDPYYFGLWLGDGHTANPRAITTKDPEILNYLAINYGIKRAHAITYVIKDEENVIKKEFMDLYNLENCTKLESKYIPNKYLINDKENRLKLLAGLIDSDGYFGGTKKPEYEIIQKSKKLAYDIVYLCRSLGFKTQIKEKMSKIGNKECGIVYRITFASDIPIPVLLKRKENIEISRFKDRRHTGINIIKKEVDNFYGFTLDGDNLFMLEDFTVTHNSGKTTIVEQWKNDLINLNEDQPLEVLTFEYEMLASDQVIRSLSSKLHKSGAYLQSADDNVITDNEMATIKKIGSSMKKMPIWYVDVPGTVEEMRNTILSFARDHKLKEQDKGLVITVDYITLTKGRQSDSEKKIVDDLYKMFMEIKKLFASDGIKVLIIAISQLNRDIDSAERKDPKLHYPTQNDIFAASSVYHNSDYVLISHNPSTIEGINWYGLPKGEKYPYGLPLFCPKTKRSMIYWHLIKNRFGKTRIMMMREKFADSKIEDYIETEES